MVLQCSLEPSQESPALLVSLQNYVREHYKPALSCSFKKGTCFPSTVLEAIQCILSKDLFPCFFHHLASWLHFHLRETQQDWMRRNSVCLLGSSSTLYLPASQGQYRARGVKGQKLG